MHCIPKELTHVHEGSRVCIVEAKLIKAISHHSLHNVSHHNRVALQLSEKLLPQLGRVLLIILYLIGTDQLWFTLHLDQLQVKLLSPVIAFEITSI
jgi:hypothetical protein